MASFEAFVVHPSEKLLEELLKLAAYYKIEISTKHPKRYVVETHLRKAC